MFSIEEPLINRKVRLINSADIGEKILPAGAIFTVRWNQTKGCYIEDEQGSPIYNYFCVANFRSV